MILTLGICMNGIKNPKEPEAMKSKLNGVSDDEIMVIISDLIYK